MLISVLALCLWINITINDKPSGNLHHKINNGWFSFHIRNAHIWNILSSEYCIIILHAKGRWFVYLLKYYICSQSPFQEHLLHLYSIFTLFIRIHTNVEKKQKEEWMNPFLKQFVRSVYIAKDERKSGLAGWLTNSLYPQPELLSVFSS